MNRFFRKKVVLKNLGPAPAPEDLPEPQGVEEFIRRGWAYHSRGKQTEAEADFRKAIEMAPNSVDAHYVLGLVLKAQGRVPEAIASFQKTQALIEQGVLESKSRAEMLRRYSKGHINELTIGDWHLEEEIWHHKG